MTKTINTGLQFKANMRDLDKKIAKLRFDVKVANAVRKAMGNADVISGSVKDTTHISVIDKDGLAVIIHKPNVWMDLSGYSPDYIDPLVVQYAKTIAKDKMLFGSDWPVITPDRWLSDFAKLDIRDEVRAKVLKQNGGQA